MTAPHLSIYTDGSAGPACPAAAAAIVVDPVKKRRIKVCALLAPMEGPQAELMGGLIGFLILQASVYRSPCEVTWRLDSRDILSRAKTLFETESSPSEAAWTFLKAVTSGYTVRLEWIKAHNGQRENEACDKACRWIRLRGENFLSHQNEGALGLEGKRAKGQSWYLVDGRPLSNSLLQNKANEPETAEMTKTLVATIRSFL